MIRAVEKKVETDLEGVDRELELASHSVDKLQLDTPTEVVVQREQRPSIATVRYLNMNNNHRIATLKRTLTILRT